MIGSRGAVFHQILKITVYSNLTIPLAHGMDSIDGDLGEGVVKFRFIDNKEEMKCGKYATQFYNDLLFGPESYSVLGKAVKPLFNLLI